MSRSLRLVHRIFLTVLVCGATVPASDAADKVVGVLTVKDALTLPNQTVRIEAEFTGKMPREESAREGVSLQLHIDGKPVATAKTDDGGRAFFDYRPKMRGTNVITVSIGDVSVIEAEKAEATLFVWERRRPILLVEVAALMQPTPSTSAAVPSASAGTKTAQSVQPVPDAAEELSRLTQYYYNVVYVPESAQTQTEGASITDIRRWLASHEFPAGLLLMSSGDGMSATLDAFKQEGWTTMKAGIGRTRSFAELLLQHRIDVVVVPELPKGELPRKAKTAKDWKEVRKKL